MRRTRVRMWGCLYVFRVTLSSAWQFMKTNDPRISMLRRFAKAMGIRFDQLMPRGKRMARKLETELKECGCEMAPDAFREMVE